MESQASPAEPARGGVFPGLKRKPGEHWTRFASRVANAFGGSVPVASLQGVTIDLAALFA